MDEETKNEMIKLDGLCPECKQEPIAVHNPDTLERLCIICYKKRS